MPLGSSKKSPNIKLNRVGFGLAGKEVRGRGGLNLRGGRGMRRGGPSGLQVFDKPLRKRVKVSNLFKKIPNFLVTI